MSEKSLEASHEADANFNRRRFLAACSAAGLANTLLPGALLVLASQPASAQTATPPAPLKITPEMIDAAAAITGITLTADQKSLMLAGLTTQREGVAAIRDLHLPNSVAPAFIFDPVPPGMKLDTLRRPITISLAPHVTFERHANDPAALESLAFLTVRELAELIKTRRVTSTDLTKMYLARLKRLDPKLHCVVNLTEERALKQAAAADAEILAGKYRGPLHGIPWGAKDLLAVKGYPTTWGAGGFEQQTFDEDAEVVKRLDKAGAVLIAKLSMGALAQGDLWGDKAHGVRTRNPWNLKQGSSGSSAGPGSATAAGCVGFSIGTETLGSISSPSTRNGATGLRPSFGLVPRTGAMALSWTMDKIGPICRAVEDCAIVLSAIYGPDGHDLSVQSAAFNWDAAFDWKKLRVGYLKSAFEPAPTTPLTAPTASATPEEMEAYRKRVADAEAAATRAIYDLKYANAALAALRKMGVTLAPLELPKLPFTSISPLLQAEAAAAFDDLTRSGRDALLVGQLAFDWPNTFRTARFYSAVDYIQAMRARTLAIAEMAKLFTTVDVIVTPSQGVQLTATNLTGNPAVIVPNGIRGNDAPAPPTDEDGSLQNVGGPGTPVSITFLGPLYSDARVAAFARAYQDATGFHLKHPQLA